MMLKRSEIARVARSYVGTPWTHQGKTRRGVDCVGLVYAVARDLRVLPAGIVIPPYRTRPDASLIGYFDRYMKNIAPSDIATGSVLIYAYGSSPYHAGIVVDVNAGSLVHAYASRRKVVYDHMEAETSGRRLYRAFDFPGVIDG